jgi:hypothetical protein
LSIRENPVGWFEIPVTNLARAQAFYETALECVLTVMDMGATKMAMFPMAPGAPGSPGTLLQSEGYSASLTGSVLYLEVDDIEATLARAEAAGGKTLVAKMSVGEHGFIAHFEDTEGNRVGLHSMT